MNEPRGGSPPAAAGIEMGCEDLTRRLAALTPAQRQLLWERLAVNAGDPGGLHVAALGRGAGRRPLSFAQERFWLADRLRPGSPMHNLALALRLRGDLDVAALNRSLAEIVRRHEALRTTIAEDGGQLNQAIAPAAGFQLAAIPLDGPPAAREAELTRRLAEEAGRPFDLGEGPPLRVALWRAGAQEHVLLVVAHHIAFDAWSQAIFLRELAALYAAFSAGRPSPLPDLPLQYADFALWQRQRLDGPLLEEQLAYWRRRLERRAPRLALPADRRGPATSARPGATHWFAVPAATANKLRELGRRCGATLFATLLAAFMALLHRYTAQNDIVVGVPVADRRRPEFDGVIGCFLNTLALAADLSANPSFTGLLAQVQQTALEAFAHSDLPFERVVQAAAALEPQGMPGADSPHEKAARLFQVMFVLRAATSEPRLPGLAVTVETVTIPHAEFDLTLDVTEEHDGGLAAGLEYSTDLFEPATIRRMAGHFQVLLEGITADPSPRIGELPLLAEAERHQLLVAWNPGHAGVFPEAGSACVHETFAEQAARQPEAVAVLAGGALITYGELNRRAGRIAQRLAGMGVGPETIVGLCAERSIEMIAGLLGILKAGGAYLPLDPSYPAARLALMLQEAGAPLVLAARELAGRLPVEPGRVVFLDAGLDANEGAETGASRPGAPGALAYVIYTSGSTGRPKGVMIEHRSLACFAEHARTAYGLVPGDRVLQFHSLSFDASVEEIFPCLAAGATLVLRSESMTASAAAFWQEVGAQGITVLSLPTAYWRRLAPSRDAAPAQITAASPLRLMIIGGEQAQAETLRAWQVGLDPNVRLVNTYGPTEATVVATAYEMPRGAGARALDEIPIGRPLPHVRAYVLDPRQNLCPIGVAGGLYLGGAGLARGYLGRPELTAERFIPDPFADKPGARLYRTGDRVRYLPDGNLVFEGRLDRQIKIHGYRVEPGEIEAVLRQHPLVREVHVAVSTDAAAGARLVAYVAPRVEALTAWLAERLPAHMMPAAFVPLDALPLTPAGKVDLAALPRDGTPRAPNTPRTVIEEVVSGVMGAVLGRSEVGREDNFFALGGHSLLAAQAIARLNEALGVGLPLAALFEFPTAASLAAHIDLARREDAAGGQLPITSAPDEPSTALAPAQEPIWRAARALPGAPLFAMPALLRLDGPLDIEALQRSLTEIVRRHRILRAAISEDGAQASMVIGPPAALPLPIVDCQDLPESEHAELMGQLAGAEFSRPFDLRAGPLFRALLVKLGADSHVLCLTAHHIAADGGSLAVLVDELAAIYAAFAAGQPSPLPDPAIQYADWVRWQQAWLHTEPARTQLAYWLDTLREPLAPLDLPTAGSRTDPRTFRYARTSRVLPPALTGQLRHACREHDATLFMVLLAGLSVLLHRYSGQRDIRVGTIVANRHRPQAERIIGLLANTVIVRGEICAGMARGELLRRVRSATLGAYANQELPFEILLEALRRERDLEGAALFQVLLVFQNNPVQPCQAAGVRITPIPAAPGAEEGREFTLSTFDWIIEADLRPEGLALTLRYNMDLFERAAARRALEDLESCLEELAGASADDPSI